MKQLRVPRENEKGSGKSNIQNGFHFSSKFADLLSDARSRAALGKGICKDEERQAYLHYTRRAYGKRIARAVRLAEDPRKIF